ncbi:MAG: helix-turn-helix domain-containing protein, partial [Promicromonosporaceae bacterium]|nr:helix-turn-helix domain-containing protein [Promicromonosporaceae bacterium]
VRVVVDAVESVADELPGGQAEIRDAILRYSRDVAFSAAEIYAEAAEARGAQDARLEATAIDYLIRGEDPAGVASRAAALGWTGKGNVSVIVGTAHADLVTAGPAGLRRTLRKLGLDTLVGVQGGRLVLVLGGTDDPLRIVDQLNMYFAPEPIVIGPEVATIAEAGDSARAALSGLAVNPAWPEAPRVGYASDLLPERALAGDAAARTALINQCYEPLLSAGHSLLETASAYLDGGRSLEVASREVGAHPNTVRTRLRKVAELTGWDPSDPREGFTLQIAFVYGRLAALEDK